jgi:hypothetical protein
MLFNAKWSNFSSGLWQEQVNVHFNEMFCWNFIHIVLAGKYLEHMVHHTQDHTNHNTTDTELAKIVGPDRQNNGWSD